MGTHIRHSDNDNRGVIDTYCFDYTSLTISHHNLFKVFVHCKKKNYHSRILPDSAGRSGTSDFRFVGPIDSCTLILGTRTCEDHEVPDDPSTFEG